MSASVVDEVTSFLGNRIRLGGLLGRTRDALTIRGKLLASVLVVLALTAPVLLVYHPLRDPHATPNQRLGAVLIGLLPLVLGATIAVFMSRRIAAPITALQQRFAAQAAELEAARDEAIATSLRYHMLFAKNPEAMWLYDVDSLRFLDVNDVAVRRYGWSREEFCAMTIRGIRPVSEQERLEQLLATHEGRDTVTHHTVRHCRKDGTPLDVEIIADDIEVAGRKMRLVLARDITERTRLEEQLRQAQKMEAIGRLAGGVAHDFNNILTVILGRAELALMGREQDKDLLEDLGEVRNAAKRAKGLTQQLLAFSRRQVLDPKPLDISTAITGMEKMLQRLIGEDVQLRTAPGANLGTVMADPGQLEQVVLNLAVNARDAMPDGGSLTIETANVELDGSAAPVPPGHYVMLAVSDTGIGMSEEIQSHLFEPFFTTKPPGTGTGLGLAMVYGIVKQSRGHISVYSEPGRGSTFKVYLPRVDAAAPAESVTAQPASLDGKETVLVVEDEEAVRAVTARVLKSRGYTVLTASGGPDALRLVGEYTGTIDLLVTDVIMPGMSGRELADQMPAVRPGIKVLFLSGYTDDAILRHGVLEPGIAFLQKPYTSQALSRKIRDVLDG